MKRNIIGVKLKVITIITVLLIVMSSFTNVLANPSTKNPSESITAMSIPVIDGVISQSTDNEYIGEWDDAKYTSEILLSNTGSSIAFDMYKKMVGDELFMAVILPADIRTIDISTFTLQVDRDNDGTLSKGDLQLRLQRYGNTIKGINNYDVDQYMDVYVYDSIKWVFIADVNENGIPLTFSWGTMVLSHNEVDSNLPTIVELTMNLFRIDQDLSYYPTDRKNHANTFNGDYESLRYGLIITGENDLEYAFPVAPQIEYVAEYAEFIYDIPIPDPIHSRDLWVEDIDVMQTTINADDTIRVVQGKETMVRVFIGQETSDFIRVAVLLSIYESFFFSPRFITEKTLVIYAPPTIRKQHFSSSANFNVSAGITNTSLLLFKARVYAIDDFIDPNQDNNILYREKLFEESSAMNIFVIPVNKNPWYRRILLPTQGMIDLLTTYTDYILPSGLVNFYQIPWQMLGSIGDNSSDSLNGRLNRLYDSIVSTRSGNYRSGRPFIRFPHQLIGVTPYGMSGAGGSSTPSWGTWGGDGAVAWISQNGGGRETGMMHEINHNLGPSSWGHHVTGEGYGCGAPDGIFSNDGDWNSLYGDNIIHDLGWNPNDGLINPNNPELMTYCLMATTPTRWIGEYRWNLLYTRMLSLTPEVPAIPVTPVQLDAGNSIETYRMISGFITNNGTGVLDPSYEIGGPDKTPNVQILNPEAYIKILYLNGSKSIIPIHVNFRDLENNTSDKSYFYKSIVDNGEIASITLNDADNDLILDSKISMNYNTYATLQYPTSAKRDEQFDVYFNMNSDNNTNLYSQLYYSPDGNGYYPISDVTTADNVSITMDGYPGGLSHFKLLVSDGFTTSTFTGSTFNIEHLPPKVNIKQKLQWITVDNETQPLSIEMNITVGESALFEIDSQDEYGWELPSFTYEILNLDTNYLETRTGRSKYADIKLKQEGKYSIKVTGTDPLTGLSSSDTIIVNVNSYVHGITNQQLLIFYDRLDKARVNYGPDISTSVSDNISKISEKSTPNNPLLFPYNITLIAILTPVIIKFYQNKYRLISKL